MAELGVNIDHVATIRQARRTYEPDRFGLPCWPSWEEPTASRFICERIGGTSKTAILRILRETVCVKLNLELACDEQVTQIACEVRPDQATLVPERRGSHDRGRFGRGRPVGSRPPVRGAASRGGRVRKPVSQGGLRQIGNPAAKLGVEAVELHTGQYALARPGHEIKPGNWKY